MYGRDVRKLAGELGLRDGAGVGYGVIDGMAVSLSDNMGGRVLNLYLGAREDAWPDIGLALSKRPEKYGIKSLTASPAAGTVEVLFLKTIGHKKRILDFVRAELPKFRDMGFPGAAKCAHCGQPLGAAETAWVVAKPEDAALPMHANCVEEHERQLSEKRVVERNEPRRLVLPVIGALLGGLIGTIPWIVIYMLGYFASVTGVVIALGANLGHKLLGGRPGKGRVFWVILTSLVMVPLALVLGEAASLGWSIFDGSLQEAWEVTRDT